jgi:SulP family sulfate permease
MFSATRETFAQHLAGASLRQNVLAGLTVGIIALPLSMALAIAVGVPPQHGLYTAIVAGVVIALGGGSRVNISGPTAAFVVILLPVTQKYGLGGLLMSGLLSGFILLAMGLARLGTLIQLVPYPVTIGFTAGIGVVIATFQIKDLFGLSTGAMDYHYLENVATLLQALPSWRWQELFIGLLTLATLLAWRRRGSKVPAHLVALAAGALIAWIAAHTIGGFDVATIGSRFHYDLPGGSGAGIPPALPTFVWPWDMPDRNGNPIGLSFELIKNLLGSAFAIAMLGALESLLCATVADGMTGGKHDPNDELIGQGLGNIAVPFLGGIPATAAIARTAANIRAGGSTPVSSVVHALVILLSILFLAPLLAHIPMASMAALLLVVAWNMSEAGHFARIVRSAPRSDMATLLVCFGLTVLFNMEVAVAVGMGLAAVLFIRRTIELTGARLVERHEHPHTQSLPGSVALYDIDGPLFFGAAQKALSDLTALHPDVETVILDMADVTMVDMTAMVAIESIVARLHRKGVLLVICNLHPRMILKLRRVGVRRKPGALLFARNLPDAARIAEAHTTRPGGLA